MPPDISQIQNPTSLDKTTAKNAHNNGKLHELDVMYKKVAKIAWNKFIPAAASLATSPTAMADINAILALCS